MENKNEALLAKIAPVDKLSQEEKLEGLSEKDFNIQWVLSNKSSFSTYDQKQAPYKRRITSIASKP